MADNGRKIAAGTVVAGIVVGGGYGALKLRVWSQDYDQAVQRGTQSTRPTPVVDPQLLTWKQVARIATGLSSVQSFVILNDGTVLVAGEKTLRVLSVDGQVLRDIPLAGSARAVTALETPEGTRFFAGAGDHVEVFDASGTALGAWPTLGADAVITCLTPGVSGQTLWAADAGGRVVVELDLSGKVLREIGREDSAKHAPGLVVPSAHLDVAIASDGTAWINNPGRHELEAFDASGVMIRQWGEFGSAIDQFGGCCNPTDFFLLSDDRFVTSEKGIPRVKIFDGRGVLQSVVTTDFVPSVAGIDVAADISGRIWVLDPATRELRLYSPETRQR